MLWNITAFAAATYFANIANLANAVDGGQDFILIGMTFVLSEVHSRWYHSLRHKGALANLFYWFRMGFVYGVILDAFKLGS
eukprot:PRCOL_00000808-RA